ncbi:hypothetical protein QPL79_06500 [Ignisphaera sp. 4213-co]|uniref:DedA family protein n=1 Tax=Ignisphaera cupida TaxID=3050454 RepID=A0ABD4Z808_9CREN|nr:hypothetical protein [Ignisphaera sp. 4213-co]MDK6029010.1 hypothetical protein [Ignisphaera sp. 4213-co]
MRIFKQVIQVIKVLEAFSTLLILIVVSMVIFVFRKAFIRFFLTTNFLLASFLISFVASVSIVPIPYTYILFLIASVYKMSLSYIVLLSLVSGLGSALGEAIAWVIGKASRAALKDTGYFNRLESLLKLVDIWGYKAVALLVFIFAFTHLPDKVLYIPLGMMGYSIWKVMPVTFIGKFLMIISILLVGNVWGALGEFFIGNEATMFVLSTILLVATMAATLFVKWDNILLNYLQRRIVKIEK